MRFIPLIIVSSLTSWVIRYTPYSLLMLRTSCCYYWLPGCFFSTQPQPQPLPAGSVPYIPHGGFVLITLSAPICCSVCLARSDKTQNLDKELDLPVLNKYKVLYLTKCIHSFTLDYYKYALLCFKYGAT